MAQTDEQARSRREMFGLTGRRAEVVRIEDVTPRYKRIILGGEELEGFKSLSPSDHFKLLLAPDGETEPAIPTFGENGPSIPEGRQRPIMRDYTPRAFDAEQNLLTIEVALHTSGVASDWAQQAKVGDVVGTLGPRGSHILDHTTFDWFVLAGDETSIPTIARRLEELPAGKKAFVFIEVDGAEDEQPLTSPADVELTWVHRNGATAGETDVLVQAIKAFDFPTEGEGFQSYTGEANSLRDIRRYLLKEKGLDKTWIDFSGHWKYGTADFDHHQPIEE